MKKLISLALLSVGLLSFAACTVEDETQRPPASTATVEAIATAEPEPTDTPTSTATSEPAQTLEPTRVLEPTATPRPTATPEPTALPEATEAPEPTATLEPTPTPTPFPVFSFVIASASVKLAAADSAQGKNSGPMLRSTATQSSPARLPTFPRARTPEPPRYSPKLAVYGPSRPNWWVTTPESEIYSAR